MVDDTGCGSADCMGDGRWDCSQVAGWLDSNGDYPWGDDDESLVRSYLLSASAAEFGQLVDAAALALDCGAWQGVATPNGGWVDGAPYDEREVLWRATAADFLRRYDAGDGALTEGMLAYATWDLACELAFLRGWCPRRPQSG